MKQTYKIVIGLALIAAGVLWILNILGVLAFEFSTKGWWTLFIIVPCLFGLANDRDKVGPCIGIGIGVPFGKGSRHDIGNEDVVSGSRRRSS